MTFTAIFLAELGDKTQIGVLSFSAASRSPWTIFAAASLALLLATAVGVLAGTLLARFIQPKAMKVISGCLFIGVGLWVLLRGD